MNEFIFSIEEIFSLDTKNGCLGYNQQEGYYIAPYQRGYKWDSESVHGQVPQLLIDIYDAFSKQSKEYFLQYITVKPDNEESLSKRFEVIDGQQRITTLSLLFHYLGQQNTESNIARGKVTYARYNEDIFEKVIACASKVETEKTQIEQQDLYYMVKAYKCIQRFLELFKQEKGEQEFQRFLKYLKEHVKLIVNKENAYVSSEDIFSNLNDNKVALTNAYLIKGLLLTHASRNVNIFGKQAPFREIIEMRTIMGRTWDEINAWFNDTKVKHYFFKSSPNEDGMEKMLQLIDTKSETAQSSTNSLIWKFRQDFQSEGEKYSNKFQMFNEFNEAVVSSNDAALLLSQIKHIYRRFKNIYDNRENCILYNLYGYVTHSKTDINYEPKKLINSTDEDLKKDLTSLILKLLPKDEDNLKKLKYKNGQDQKIHQWLLALSVFPEDFSTQSRFDFYSYALESKSLEHISPQNPDQEIKIDSSLINWYCDAIKRHYQSNNQEADELIKSISENKKIESAKIGFMFNQLTDVDVIGNMAYLSGEVNSSLSNNPFPIKRRIIQEKANQGKFVARHTLDVFSKSLPNSEKESFNPDFVNWDDVDVKAHTAWMVKRLDVIKNLLANILTK